MKLRQKVIVGDGSEKFQRFNHDGFFDLTIQHQNIILQRRFGHAWVGNPITEEEFQSGIRSGPPRGYGVIF